MKKNNLGFELQSRVRRYLEYTIKNENNNEQMDGILNKLTKSLKNELILQSYQKYIQNSKFFKNFSFKTQEKIVLSLKELKLSPEESIHYVLLNKIFQSKCIFFEKEQENDDNPLYILVDGNIEEALADKTSGKIQTIRQIAVVFAYLYFFFI